MNKDCTKVLTRRVPAVAGVIRVDCVLAALVVIVIYSTVLSRGGYAHERSLSAEIPDYMHGVAAPHSSRALSNWMDSQDRPSSFF